jgi:hypothetical protein
MIIERVFRLIIPDATPLLVLPPHIGADALNFEGRI